LHAGVDGCSLQVIAETRIDGIKWSSTLRIDRFVEKSDTDWLHSFTNLAWILQTLRARDGGFWHNTPSSLFNCWNNPRLLDNNPGKREIKITLEKLAMVHRANLHWTRVRTPLAVSAMTDPLSAQPDPGQTSWDDRL
jgi:hypothetical protein